VSSDQKNENSSAFDELYEEAGHFAINTGDETIHAKRISGTWRNIKWATASVWLAFFFGPYLRLGDRQAVLFDIPDRKFHIFHITVLPQDFWMLSLVLLFFAILLAVITATIGRAYCGYFCFQTVWTDIYTWIEDMLEGSPVKRRKLEKAPWGLKKIGIKATKHLLWMVIAFLTGVSFVAWFTDAYQLWADIVSFNLAGPALITITMFFFGTYVLAGFLREQVCFWLCPYARLQGVMVDQTTVVPTYDFNRGEPRGRRKKGSDASAQGDCVDCNQCIAVCPTGVDIRYGQQEGCIMCGLCIDACDAVMEKVDLPKGLVRYASLDELEGRENPPIFKRPRVLIYTAILTIALIGISLGLGSLDAVELKVLHSRLPLFVVQSDGSIRNKYTLKVLNKTTTEMQVKISATGHENLQLSGAEGEFKVSPGSVYPKTVFVSVPKQDLKTESSPVVFHVEGVDKENQQFKHSRESVFIGPAR
jgi:cytochrome c oxidase accessory protein FixG